MNFGGDMAQDNRDLIVGTAVAAECCGASGEGCDASTVFGGGKLRTGARMLTGARLLSAAWAYALLATITMLAGMAVSAPARANSIAFPTPVTFAMDPCGGYCGPAAQATGDFNGDGKLDVLNLENNAVLDVVFGNGDGSFQQPVSTNIAAPNYHPGAIAVGDFNGDHIEDVAVWASNATTGDSQLNIYLGTGTGEFTGGATFNAPNSNDYNPTPNTLVTADVNGDGKLDLIALTPYSGVFVFLGNGDGSFQTPVTYTTGAVDFSAGVAVADVNGDGKPDLVFAVDDGISVALNTGGGTFGTPAYYASGIGYSQIFGGIAIGDLGGDKGPDVVVLQSSGVAVVYLNQGGGTFAVGSTISAPAVNGTNNLVLADINNDKKLDILFPDVAGDVFTYYGTGRGTFTAGPVYPLEQPGAANYVVAVGDFNGDGTLDLLDDNGYATSTVSLGRGDGSFRTAQLYAYSTNGALNITSADFNGDGIPDIAQSVTGTLEEGGTSINGFIGINLSSSHGVLGATSYATASTCINNAVQSVATGDVNGDGKADLVATMADEDATGCQNHTVAVLEGLGTGKFKKAAYYATGATAQELTVYLVDLNGDGHLDIVIANADSSISVLLNRGTGTYKTEPLITSLVALRNYGTYLTFGDFNGDGKTDIAASLVNGSGAVYVLPGQGNGTFGAPLETATPNYPTALVAADFNGDGKTDLVVAGDGSGCYYGSPYGVNYVFLQGSGNGTFSSGSVNCGGYNAGAGAALAADLNGDGKLDVVIATNGSAGGPLVLQGNGDGTFVVRPINYTGENHSSVAVGDFNGDGTPDIAVLDQGSFVPSWVSIMLNSTQPLSVSPLTVNYGTEAVGKSKSETVILTNNEATALTITSVTVGGADAGDFTETNTCGRGLKAGWDCTITVKFEPTATGTRTGTLTIVDGAGTQTVQLEGSG
jgi:hypothetical protein